MRKVLALILSALIFSTLFLGCPKKAVKEEVIPPPPEKEEVEAPPTEEKKPTIVLETIHFDFDKYDIRPGDAEILKRNAEVLKQYPDVKIIIEGHCCPIGTTEYNLGLGQRRANSAKDYLVKLGISADRIETISYGEERPVTTDPKEYWKNRRCEFKVKE
ncbi:MAG: OmpA family protein [candidate division WOR-3 bacterium]|nr:OmpA family protein [candidate division WOR-3 bacterium]MCX7836948.1 OmpA family protein [candidate division WOR-3 bacterium]MDW8114150.1 OmpA family protein [candidate division WOR-3 bacterium]